MRNQYDYNTNRWRTIARTSTKHNIAEDIDGDRFPLAHLEPTNPAIEALSDDTKFLCAIACYCKTNDDYDDARDMMSHVAQPERRTAFDSLSAEAKAGLKASAERAAALVAEIQGMEPAIAHKALAKLTQPVHRQVWLKLSPEFQAQVLDAIALSNEQVNPAKEPAIAPQPNHKPQEAALSPAEAAQVVNDGNGAEEGDEALWFPANSSEGAVFEAKWCDRCECQEDCSVLEVAAMGTQPGVWVREGGRAICAEFSELVEKSDRSSVGSATVINLSDRLEVRNEPSFYYCGRYMKASRGRDEFDISPLHNPARVRVEGDREPAIASYVELRIIPALEAQSGAIWDELQKLAGRVRSGEDLLLGCWCTPKRCHVDVIRIAVNGLANGDEIEQIIDDVRALLPAEQMKLVEAIAQ